MLHELADIASDVIMPGRYLVEALPALRYLPAWFPGASFKRKAAVASRRLSDIIQRLYSAGKEKLVSTIASDILQLTDSSIIVIVKGARYITDFRSFYHAP